MKENMYLRLLKYKENGFTLSGQFKRHLPLILFRILVLFALYFNYIYLPRPLPVELKFLFFGMVSGAQLQELIWICKHHQTWTLLVDSTDWKKVEIKSKCG